MILTAAAKILNRLGVRLAEAAQAVRADAHLPVVVVGMLSLAVLAVLFGFGGDRPPRSVASRVASAAIPSRDPARPMTPSPRSAAVTAPSAAAFRDERPLIEPGISATELVAVQSDPATVAAAMTPLPPPASPPQPSANREIQRGYSLVEILGKEQDEEAYRQLLAHGDRMLAMGDVAGARGFFKRAADAGNPEAAIAMGATYDPTVLTQLQVRGLAPDRALARRWYLKAIEFGSKDAAERLQQLGDAPGTPTAPRR